MKGRIRKKEIKRGRERRMRGRGGEEKERGEKALTEMIEIETLFIQTLLSTGTNQPRGRWKEKETPGRG